MKLFDEVITNVANLCDSYSTRRLETDGVSWEDAGNTNMVLRNESAFELGGWDGRFPAIGSTFITANEDLVPDDEIVLIGQDIPEITAETPYARIALVRVKPETMGEGNALYSAIKNIEYLKYHINPKGFMMRVSTIKNRESVRVSKEAIANGLTFQKVGNFMIKAFKLNPKVACDRWIVRLRQRTQPPCLSSRKAWHPSAPDCFYIFLSEK